MAGKHIISPAKARDYVRAVRDAGHDPREIRFEPDGTIRLIFGGEAGSPAAPLDEWMAKREAR